jgi:hypothetical protein
MDSGVAGKHRARFLFRATFVVYGLGLLKMTHSNLRFEKVKKGDAALASRRIRDVILTARINAT